MSIAKAHESTKSIDIEPIRPILARVIERWHPLQIWLFGSRARGENRPDSDWDLLAIVPDCPEPADFDDPMTVWRVKRELTKLADIDRRIAELQEMRGALARLASGCENGAALGSCPFLDELGRPLESMECA